MRCSHEQEMDLMYPETNRQNYKSFENILEYFFMEKKFENATIRNLSNHKRSYKENYLDKFFQLNSQRRVFYEIEIAADEDIAYIRYLTIINEHKFKDDKQHNLFKQYRCGGYNTFIKGTIIDGKQQIKLFKFLLKQGILTKENVDELNSLKKKNRVLLCISRNPIDYLFCSTHQSYTSCISLDSEYESAYYMGLGGLSLDPNRVLLFTTTGALRSYQIKGNTFKHFRYACRTWGIMDKKYKLLTIKNYPSPTPNFAKQLNKIGIKAGIYEDKSVGLFNFEVPKFINGDIAFIDLEEMFFDGCKEHNFVKYSKNGSMGGTDRSFYFTRGFEQLQDFEDLSDECIYCGSCGDASDQRTYLLIEMENHIVRIAIMKDIHRVMSVERKHIEMIFIA